MNAQVIVTPNGERLVVLPEAEYQILVEPAEDAADLEAIRRFDIALAAGDEELIPSEIVDRLLNGENKVRVWREFRGLTQEETAVRAGISAARLARTRERLGGHRNGSARGARTGAQGRRRRPAGPASVTEGYIIGCRVKEVG